VTVFISHSFENKPEFDNVADQLEQANVSYWDPNKVQSGGSLRDQLRTAVDQCSVCVFIATKRALQSSWCGAELGAFWGAGKPVIVYVADSSLEEKELPPIVQGDVWERRISRVVARAGELTEAAQSNLGSATIGAMTPGQLQSLIVSALSLVAETTKSTPRATTPEELGSAATGAARTVLESFQATSDLVNSSLEPWRSQILWVDDRPDNNLYPRQAFESIGIEITLTLTTQEALDKLSSVKRFGAIISDMGRKEGPREGYVLLDAIRRRGDNTPFFIYAGSSALRHKNETKERGGQGTTNDARELFSMVTQALHRSIAQEDLPESPEG
jgi:CheY-like chemotaxis protein